MYKVKPLKPVTDDYGVTTWLAKFNATTDYEDDWYDWRVVGNLVRFNSNGGNFQENLGEATTLEEAQQLVDAHHEQQVKALMDALLEPPQWQEGEIPEPEGPSVLVVKFKSGMLKCIPASSDGEERYWSEFRYSFANNEWLIQPIHLPDAPPAQTNS